MLFFKLYFSVCHNNRYTGNEMLFFKEYLSVCHNNLWTLDEMLFFGHLSVCGKSH